MGDGHMRRRNETRFKRIDGDVDEEEAGSLMRRFTVISLRYKKDLVS